MRRDVGEDGEQRAEELSGVMGVPSLMTLTVSRLYTSAKHHNVHLKYL